MCSVTLEYNVKDQLVSNTTNAFTQTDHYTALHNTSVLRYPQSL